MKSIHTFSIRAGSLSSGARREIRRLSNRTHEDHEDRPLLSGFPENDPRLQQLYSILSSERLVPQPRIWGRPPPACALQVTRRYRPSDLIQHDYVEWIIGGTQWSGFRPEPDGPLELSDVIEISCCPGDDFNRHKARVATVYNRIVVVRDRVKRLAEAAGMQRVFFRPTILTDRFGRYPPIKTENRKRITWDEIGEEPWWELTSDLRLPRVSQAHLELVDNDGSPYVYGVSKGCIRQDGFFSYPELRYRESEIRALEPFDCALTYEPFGGNPREENLIRVISRRFYELMIRNFIRVKAVPVRLDPD